MRERGVLHFVTLLDKKLYGNKGIQFEQWLEKMGSDTLVHRDYKLLHKLYKKGYFEEKAKKYQ